jgi:N-dimethylarginine dimethylaminohydrolase
MSDETKITAEPRSKKFFEEQYLKGESWIAKTSFSAGLKPWDIFSFYDIKPGTEFTPEEFRKIMEFPPILMHSAGAYSVEDSTSENGWTQESLNEGIKDPQKLKKMALYENAALAGIYSANGHHVNLMLAQPAQRDGVYCTDSDKTVQKFIINEKGNYVAQETVSLIITFMHEDRGNESVWKAETLREAGGRQPNPRKVIRMENPKEGGDTRFINFDTEGRKGGFIMMGMLEETDRTHTRSTMAGNIEMGEKLQLPIENFKLTGKFYHMDTTGIPRNDGSFFTNKKCYADNESWNTLKEIFGNKLIEVPFKDLEDNFLGNGVCFGKNIYTCDRISDESKRALTKGGYNVFLTPIEAFIDSGGGHRCNTSFMNYISNNGYKFESKPDEHGQVFRLNIDYSKPVDGLGETSPFTLHEQKYQQGKYVEEKQPCKTISALGIVFPDSKSYDVKSNSGIEMG